MSASASPDPSLIESVRESPSAMALLDQHMRYIAWSERWVRDHGLGESGLVEGASHYDVFPELGDGWRAIHSYCLRGHSEQGDVEPFKRADGSTQWVRNIIRPWYTDANESQVGGLILFTEDLTAQIEAQRQLAQQKSLLNTVVNHAPAVLYAFDASGVVTLSLGQGLTGLGRDAVGSSLIDDFEHIRGLAEAIGRVLNGESVSWESEAHGQYFETSAVPTVEDDVVTGGLAVAVDVTERVQAQRQAQIQAEGLRRVLSVTSRPGSFEMQVQALLREMSGFLGLDGGVLAHVQNDVFRCLWSAAPEGVPIEPGTERPLAETYCDLILKSEGVLAIDHIAESEHASHPAYVAEPYEAYIGAPVYVEGRLYGTLSFRSRKAATRPFEDSDLDLVQLAAQWAGGLIERDLRGQETADQAARLRTLADLFAVRSGSVEDNVREALTLLCSQVGVDIGVFSRVDVDAGRYEVVSAHHPEEIDITEGSVTDLGNTYCYLTLDASDVVAIDEVRRAAEHTHSLYPAFVPTAFIGAPVSVNGATYGLVDLSALTPRYEPFSESDRDLIRLVASWAGGLVERSQQMANRADDPADGVVDDPDAEYHDLVKRSLLDAMSHEIRTPMNSVVGFGDLLETTDLDDVQREYVGTIRRASERLLRLIDDVLDFSKVEADRIEFENAPFEVVPMAEGVLEQFAPVATRKGIELAFVLDESGDGSPLVPLRVVGDEQRIHQVLTNLVSNAVKFTQSGAVELALRVTSIRDTDPPGTIPLEFEVTDTGIGISADRLMDVFEPFVQADSSTTRQYGGTGLGLSISRQLIELMGGSIEADSRLGEGSRFRVRIPVLATEYLNRRVIRPSWIALSGLRVFLIDDDAAALKITSDKCRAWGMSVRATTEPYELLKWLDDGESCQLGILDMQMPVMDGIDLAKAIRDRRGAQDLPLVILSSDSRARHAPGLVQAVLQKPVSSATLHALLLRVVGARDASQRSDRRPAGDRGAARPVARGPVRILIAEDEPDNQTLTLHMLRTLGYEAEVAGNGAEALAKMQAAAYDLVFMDVMMPQMDGLEATRRLRSELVSFEQPRIVALTARALRSDREACLQAGMDDYLSKPVRIGDLARAIDAVAAA